MEAARFLLRQNLDFIFEIFFRFADQGPGECAAETDRQQKADQRDDDQAQDGVPRLRQHRLCRPALNHFKYIFKSLYVKIQAMPLCHKGSNR